MSLHKRDCVPCTGGVPPLQPLEAATLLRELAEGWEVVDNHHLQKTFALKDFAHALQYVDRIGAMAQEQHHHPDLFLAWGRVEVKIWTHAINGLTESDFIFAAKCDALL